VFSTDPLSRGEEIARDPTLTLLAALTLVATTCGEAPAQKPPRTPILTGSAKLEIKDAQIEATRASQSTLTIGMHSPWTPAGSIPRAFVRGTQQKYDYLVNDAMSRACPRRVRLQPGEHAEMTADFRRAAFRLRRA